MEYGDWKVVLHRKKQSKKKRNDLICSNRSEHDPDCKLCYHIEDWEPISCRFGSDCGKIADFCPFYHELLESKLDYLQKCLSIKNSYYEKNKEKYIELFFS